MKSRAAYCFAQLAAACLSRLRGGDPPPAPQTPAPGPIASEEAPVPPPPTPSVTAPPVGEPVSEDADRRPEGRPLRHRSARPVPLARGRQGTRGAGVDEGARRPSTRAHLAGAPRARGAPRETEGARLRGLARGPDPPRRPPLLHAPVGDAGEGRRLRPARGKPGRSACFSIRTRGRRTGARACTRGACRGMGSASPSTSPRTIPIEATMYVMGVDTGKVSAKDVIPGTKYGYAAWTPKGDSFYYARLPVDPSIPTEARPGYTEVRFHQLGSDPAKDEVVRERTGDPTKGLGVSLSKDGRWLFVIVEHGWTSSDVYFRDLHKPAKTWTPLTEGKDALYNVSSFRGHFYVHTNEGAPKWRVFSVDPAHPERDAWKEVVPERKDATLDTVQLIGGALGPHVPQGRGDAPRAPRPRRPALQGNRAPRDRVRRLLRRSRSGRRLLLLRDVQLPPGDPLVLGARSAPRQGRNQGRDGLGVGQAEGPGRPHGVRRRANLLQLQGRDARADVRGARQGDVARRKGAGIPHGVRRVQRVGDALLPEVGFSVARAAEESSST